MNKIAAVSMIKNEADIVESFARHVLKIACCTNQSIMA